MEINRTLLVKRAGELRSAVEQRAAALDEARGALAEIVAMLSFVDRPDAPVEVVSVSPVEAQSKPVEAGGCADGTRGCAEKAE